MMIPLDVPNNMRNTYEKNFKKATKSEHERLMLFAGDQKIEHLNKDFYGDSKIGTIPLENNDPEHLFKIASQANIGVFATQLGNIARYGMDYKTIDYLVKINSKTNIVKTDQADPISITLNTIEDVIQLRDENDLSIIGIGYTVYLGSEYEHVMLQEAAQLISEAHSNGLIAVLWMYPRGKAVENEKDPDLIAGATGVAACLGADFAKVIVPKKDGEDSNQLLIQATTSAGRTGVICSGGSSEDPETFIKELYDQIHISGAKGNATGRNIHQKTLDDAVKFANAIYAITVENKSVEEALNIYNS